MNTRTLTLFEHEPAPEGIPGPVVEWLLGLRHNGRELFVRTNRSFRATSFVGIVQHRNYTVQVLPKMYRRTLAPDAQSERIGQATANLLFLLGYTKKLELTAAELARLASWRAPLLEFLCWLFAHKLWEAVRRGLMRGYVGVEDRLGVVRGRWLLAKQLRRSDSWRADLLDVSYEEFSEDNLPNRLLNATVWLLSRWARELETRRLLTVLRTMLGDITHAIPKPGDFARAQIWMDRYRWRTKEQTLYRAILNLARIFWEREGWQWKTGPSEVFVWMFDMNQLFEEFVAQFIRCHLGNYLRQRGWNLFAQSGTRCLLWSPQIHWRFRLIPDIRIENAEGQTVLIIDTKYKTPQWNERKSPIEPADAYQMFAYKERYACPWVVLLYPQEDSPVRLPFSGEQGSRPWLFVCTVDLRRDFLQASEREALAQEIQTILHGEEVAYGFI
jgi:5-methylcytosine-specific restriction enzyme subunit McrC